MSPITCPRCGASMPANARICLNCRYEVARAEGAEGDPGPATASAPTPTPAPPPPPSFGSGQHVVGTEIPPGTYRTRTAAAGCYWDRDRGFGGTLDDVIANDNTDGPAVVTIDPTDKGFKTSRCATWTANLAAITSNPASLGEGTFIVGTDFQPGIYRSFGGAECYWERDAAFGAAGTDGISANENTSGPATVSIAASDKGFKSARCGTWTRVG